MQSCPLLAKLPYRNRSVSSVGPFPDTNGQPESCDVPIPGSSLRVERKRNNCENVSAKNQWRFPRQLAHVCHRGWQHQARPELGHKQE